MNNCIPADSKLPEFKRVNFHKTGATLGMDWVISNVPRGKNSEIMTQAVADHLQRVHDLGLYVLSLGLDTEAKIREAAATLEAVKWCIENQYIFYDCDETGNIIVEHLENTANCGAEGQTLPLAVAALKGQAK